MDNLQKYHVSFIGSGNVAFHLAKALYKAGAVIDEVWSPNALHRQALAAEVEAKEADKLTALTTASDVYIIAVPDGRVAEVVAALPKVKGIVAHTSGITSMQVVSKRFKNSGVFYPLQTFSKQRPVAVNEVPFCIEGNTEYATQTLTQLAAMLSKNIHAVSSDERKKLHLAAVFVSNFVNHLYQTANTITNENNLPFSLLIPLIEEVAAKIKTLSPAEAQTGPARRNDKKTIAVHREMLNAHPDFEVLYNLITGQITKRYYE